jgi:hypothetical protein
LRQETDNNKKIKLGVINMFNYSKLKAYFKILFTLAIFIVNSPLYPYSPRQEFIINSIQNEYRNKIELLTNQISQANVKEKLIQIEELKKELNKTLNHNDTSQIIEPIRTRDTVSKDLEKIIGELTQIELATNIINSLNSELNSLNLTSQIINSEQEETNKILSINSLIDTNIYNSNENEVSLLDSVDNTITPLGKIQLALDLDINKKNITELNVTTEKIRNIVNNQNLYENLNQELQKTAQHLMSYLNTIQYINENEDSIENFMEKSENKFSYYGLNAIKNGTKSTILKATTSLLMPLTYKAFNYTFFKQCIDLNLNEIDLNIYKNWELYATFSSQILLNKIPNMLFKLGSSLAFPVIASKLGLPLTMFAIASAPIQGTLSAIGNIKEQYKTKQEFKNRILQKFHELSEFLNQLRQLTEFLDQNENFRDLTINIKELVYHNQDDALTGFLRMINDTQNYEQYKEKETLKSIYSFYLNTFIKMAIPEYKELIVNALKDLGKIDVLLSKAKLCKDQNYCITECIQRPGKPYIKFTNTNTPRISQNETNDLISIELNERQVFGFTQDYIKRYKLLLDNLILSHIGITKAEKAVITPVDSINSMLNTNDLENFRMIVNKVYYSNKLEKKLIFINKTELAKNISDLDFVSKKTYETLSNALEKMLIPAMNNSYYFYI